MPSSIIAGVPHSLLISVFWLQVPPGVVGEVLRPAVGLPGPSTSKVSWSSRAMPPGPSVAVRAAEAGHEDAIGPAVQGVRTGVAGLRGELGRLDRLEQRGLAWVGSGVEHIDVRRAETGHEQEATGQAGHVMTLVHQRAAAGVPAEVVELVPGAGSRSSRPPCRMSRNRDPRRGP